MALTILDAAAKQDPKVRETCGMLVRTETRYGRSGSSRRGASRSRR
jgi:hypothetical protein